MKNSEKKHLRDHHTFLCNPFMRTQFIGFDITTPNCATYIDGERRVFL